MSIATDFDGSVTEAQAAELASQQPYLMTGGRPTDHGGCMVLLADFWRSENDMCPNRATHRVVVDDYRCGAVSGGMFGPATTYSKVCAGHEEQVRQAPGFRSSEALA